MALDNSNEMVMPVAPMYGGGNGGFGWNDGSFWIIILFLFAFMGNGWGGGWGGGSDAIINNDVQRGFDQQAVMSGINGISTNMATGFANAEVSRCAAQANLLQSLNDLAMGLQGMSAANAASIADLKYTLATEACANRNAAAANTQAILDKMCQQELEAERRENENLRTQLNMANLAASQTAQTSRILADNAAQTAALEQYLAPVPRPAYIVQNPNGCNCGNYYNGCGTCA